MLNLQNVYPLGSISLEHKLGLIKNSHDICSSKPQLPAILPVIIVRGKKYVGIWTFDFSRKSWMKLRSTELEVSAYIYSGNQPYTLGSLIASPTLNKKIALTLYCSPLTGLNSMNVSMICDKVEWIKCCGRGGRNRNGRRRRLGNLKTGELLPCASLKKSRPNISKRSTHDGQE